MAEIMNGTDLFLFVDEADGDTPLAHATSHSISYSMGTRETSDKSSGNATTIAPTRTRYTGSADGLVTFDADCDYHTLMAFVIARTKLFITSAHVATGAVDLSMKNYTGEIYLTDVTLNAADQENASYSITFEGNGALTPVDAV
jgi:predicted secreted protein